MDFEELINRILSILLWTLSSVIVLIVAVKIVGRL